MTNQNIGVIGVFALTLCLFLLRHFVLARRPNSVKRYGTYGRPDDKAVWNRGADSRGDQVSAEDDSWVWTTEHDSKSNMPTAPHQPRLL